MKFYKSVDNEFICETHKEELDAENLDTELSEEDAIDICKENHVHRITCAFCDNYADYFFETATKEELSRNAMLLGLDI